MHPEDVQNGDVNHRIWKFLRYRLVDLPVESLACSWAANGDIAKDYAGRIRRGEVPPAIVYDLDANEMIDGCHRLAAAKIAGLEAITAFVGTRQDIDPDWGDEELAAEGF
jgi:hypothetical protein